MLLPLLTAACGVVLVGLAAGLLNPPGWWRGAVRGYARPGRLDPKLIEPGRCQVRLEYAGPRPVDVVHAIRAATGLPFEQVEAVVRNAPTRVTHSVSEASAERLRDRIERAGGTVTLVVATR